MGRKPIERTCCACLIHGISFNKLSKKDEKKITLTAKLKICIQEVEWVPSYHICFKCTDLLNIAYSFRVTCLNSDLIRKGGHGVVKDEELDIKEELFSENVLAQEKSENNCLVEDKIVDNTKDEDYNEEVFSTAEDDEVNDPSYCSETEQENEKSQSYLDYDEYKHQKRKHLRKPRECKDKAEKTTKKRKKLKFECDNCQLNFTASTKLVYHCVKEHSMDLKDIKPFVCDRCPQRFSTSSNLWQHIKYHDGIKCNMCSYCGKGFITKTDLINHEKKHLNRREYKCEACGKSFNTHKDIRSHKLIVHTDSSKWKYVCEICNKPFPIKSNYDSHMRRHTGDKKFACHLCDKKFTTKCDLQRHTRSHSHVREHQCQHCDKEYKDERVLKVHMAKIHGIGVGKVKIPVRERKYACHFCPKAYYAKNKLTRHIYTHSGEKPFNCPICEKKFNDKSYVKQHLRNTHNVEQQDTLENELKINYMDTIVRSTVETGVVKIG